jgi:hypothetical protein
MTLTKSLPIALTVDVEGEWFELPGEQGSFDINQVLNAVECLETVLDRIETRIESRIPITWFIRCDDSVAATTGEAWGLLQSLDSFIKRRTILGDEFGLHPHLYRLTQGKWESETNHEQQQAQVERAAEAWQSYFGSKPRLSRMGEAVMNNTLANCLSKLDIKIDSSALSNRKRFDSGFQFDWTGTPSLSYLPSVKDYRRPANNGEATHSFVEMPFTMLPIKASHDKEPIDRYCNLAFRPNLIKRAVQLIDPPENLVAVVHPHELLSGSHDHPIIAHKPTVLEENIFCLSNAFGDLDFTLLTSLHNRQ